MRTKIILCALALVAVLGISCSTSKKCCGSCTTRAATAPAMEKLPPPLPAPASQDEKMAWFREAKYGLFIHWGLYCQPAGEWKGKPIAGDDKNIYLTIINKAHGPASPAAKISLEKFSHVEFLLLTAPENNVTANAGETLGGSEIKNDGSWNGKWTPLKSAVMSIPLATAAVLRLPAN